LKITTHTIKTKDQNKTKKTHKILLPAINAPHWKRKTA
jgi:hypothetical protein